jgi:hypothetical protein
MWIMIVTPRIPQDLGAKTLEEEKLIRDGLTMFLRPSDDEDEVIPQP